MAHSPRKRAPRTTIPATFNQTWDDKDAAFLDPSALPLSKIPRGWERKQEVKKVGQGREKKIWRRFNLRSRNSNTPNDDDEEQHDSRSRPVKKLQHLSPKTMEKTTIVPDGRKRAFKATRWDRRKSLLPRKKVIQTEDSLVDAGEIEDNENDSQLTIEEDCDSFSQAEPPGNEVVDILQNPMPKMSDRRSTFTFTMDPTTTDDLMHHESLNGQEGTEPNFDTSFTEEATLANFFRSPIKGTSIHIAALPNEIVYPELPRSSSQEMETDDIAEPVILTEEACHVVEDNVVGRWNASIESNETPSKQQTEAEEFETGNVEHDNIQSTVENPLALPEVTYPDLSSSAIETSMLSTTSEELGAAQEDIEMSDSTMDPCNDDDRVDGDTITLTEGGLSEEEFTEASLQLDIQREYEETLPDRQATSAASHDQYEEAIPEARGEQDGFNTDSVDNQGSGFQEGLTTVQTETLDIESFGHLSASPSSTTCLQFSPQKEHIETAKDDITDGLTLAFTSAKSSSAEPLPRKLHSPPPPQRMESGPDDVTMTIAIDDDTAILKDFLSRAAATKAERAAIVTHRRESLQNRRDSDVVRHALASPRKVLEDKDPNSPSKYDNDATLDLSQTLTLAMPDDSLASPNPDLESTEDEKSLRGSRRSSRTKKSRLPALAPTAQAQAPKIAIRRADGNEVVVLKRNDVQEMASLTRSNTRKNKQGAFGVAVRLLKLAMDAASLAPIDDGTKELVVGKNVRWDEQLAYYQENPETIAERESLATPDELSMPDSSSTPKVRTKTSKDSTPKIRRVRGLGTANGTPGKGLLAPASLLPEMVQEEKEANQPPLQQLPRPKATKMKKMPVASTSIDSAVSSSLTDTKLPTLDIAPVGVQPAAQRKSRLAPPKKVMLPQPITSIPSEGKENTQRLGFADATPKKGIPAPKVLLPTTLSVESALPKRRGRKVL